MSILLIIGIIILVLWLLGFIFFKSIGAIMSDKKVGGKQEGGDWWVLNGSVI